MPCSGYLNIPAELGKGMAGLAPCIFIYFYLMNNVLFCSYLASLGEPYDDLKVAPNNCFGCQIRAMHVNASTSSTGSRPSPGHTLALEKALKPATFLQ